MSYAEMDHWSRAHHAVAVRAFYKNGDSDASAKQEYWHIFNLERHKSVPTEQDHIS